MTSLAPNTIPSAPSSTPQASSNTPSAHSGSQSTSGQSSTIAAATAGSRPTQVLYAQAAKKPSYTPPIVSSTVGSSPPVVGGAPGSNARTSNASPVNGKNQVAPAVPTVTPAMNSVIVNGTSGPSNGHGRKPSAVSGGNGGNAWMHNGNPQANRPQQNNQPSIRFGSFPPDQSMQPVPGSAPISSPNLSAPAVPNPRISSPQMSPSPLPQPAVSGGPITQGMQNQNIQFGAWGDRGDQRQMHRPAPMPIPPVPPTSQGPGHMRRESSNSHQQHPEMPQSGMGSNRGGMAGNNRRNQGPPFGGQNTYQHQPQGYNNHNNYNNNRNAPNQSRGSGYQAPINQPHYPNVPGTNYQSPRQPPRSPAMHHPLPHTQPVVPHSLPGTPQLGTVPIANSPSFQPANMYPTVHQQQLYPPAQQQYDPNMYPHPSYAAHIHGYGQYPGGPPPASPRGQYAALNHPGPYMNINLGYAAPPTAMTRSASSAAADINRPPSGFGVQHTPMISPTPPINPAFFKKPEKVSRGVKITRPDGTPLNLNAEPLETPKAKPVVVSSPSSSSSPVIVSSGNPPPRPTVTDKKPTAELGGVLALQVQKRIEENEARELELKKAEEERSKKEAKEAEEKKRKEEEERKRKEEEEERLRKEAEEKARLEEEERKRKEAEAARIAKEKAEEEARIAKEKEEEEKRRKEEEEKRIREEEERRLREEEEKLRKAEEEERLRKEEEERLLKAKEEEERRLKEAEEKRLKEEQEAKQKAKEDAERLAKEEQERKAREEAKAAAEAAAAAAKSTEAPTEDTAQQTKPEPVAQVSSPQPLPAADEATRPTKLRGSKPSPLVIKPSTEPGPPSAALTALRSARFIGDINSVKYPDNILSPNPALNSAAPAGKFKYQKDFLLQFQNVFTEKPSVDWDQIIRDSVGEPTDSARPSASSKMGVGLGGGRSGSRSGATAAQPPIGTMSSMGPMGGFGTGKFGLPPMTSTQRFEQSNRALASNPLAAVGQFRAGPPSISRTNSSQGLPQQGGLPQSPRIRSQRGTSKRGNTAGGVAMEKSESKQAEPKPVLTIPVSDVKPLVSSGTGWKPRTVQAAASTGAAPGALSAVAPPVPTEDNRLSPEMVQRKVKAALNKMTPEKFDKISGQILDIASQSKFETDGRTLRQVIQLTFEKATDEAAWSSMYAKFCKVMMESMDPNIKDENIKDVRTGKVVTGGILFRKYLLNRCQEEFQRGWKVNLPPKPEGETDEAAMLSDEYYIAAAAKRRGLGLIQFIGELFKLGMLTERIMQECVKKLVDYEGVPEEAEVESLCKLLRTIGAVLDGSEKSRSSMDAYFDRIQTMVNHPEIQSRLKFMLMDIIDLRKKNWEVKEVDKGPKTLAEIQADVAKAAAEKEAASRANAQRGGRTGGGGRNDGRSYSQGGNYGQSDYQRQMAQNTINSDDLRRLKQRNDRNQNSGQTLGPPTMFGPGARGSNPKRGGMGPPSFNRGDDSGPTSRTATPPAGASTSRNSFGVLGDMGSHANDGDANDSISPAPSAASSPPLAKATPVMRSLSGME